MWSYIPLSKKPPDYLLNNSVKMNRFQ